MYVPPEHNFYLTQLSDLPNGVFLCWKIHKSKVLQQRDHIFTIFITENCSESVESEIYSSVICFVNTLLFSAQCSVQCYIISPFPFQTKRQYLKAFLSACFYSYATILHNRARHQKSISTKMQWGFTFVPRTPKITTF